MPGVFTVNARAEVAVLIDSEHEGAIDLGTCTFKASRIRQKCHPTSNHSARAARAGQGSLSSLPPLAGFVHRVAIKVLLSWRRLCLQAALLVASLLLGSTARAAALPTVPNYQVGEQAEAEVVTPIPLIVFDSARTERLRKAEAQKAPAIFRYVPTTRQNAEEEMRAVFSDTRSRFVASLERLFGHEAPLLTTELAQPQFGDFLRIFASKNAGFPLSTNLAELWALGDPGDLVIEMLLARFRRFTNSYVRADLPAGERLTTASVRLVPVASTNDAPSLAAADKQGRTVARTNLLTLDKLRQQALKDPRPGERAALDFIAGFVRPNCFFDPELTRQARARRTEAINAADRYEAGERIVGKGGTITAKVKLALDELRAQTEPARIRALALSEQARVEAERARAELAVEATRRVNRWLLAGLGVAAASAIMLGGLWAKRRRRPLLDGVNPPFAISTLDESSAVADATWRERAVVAEARAEKVTALLRAQLLPHLARWMMNELVRKLVTQRSESQTSQQMAEREVGELVERLAQLQAPLEDRLKAYERRIAELEAELAAKGEQNLELIKAKIETTRRQMEGERSQEPLTWN
jgi:hypothetical protein